MDDDIGFVFLHLIDRVTPSHLVLLKYFDNPHRWSKDRNAEGAHILDGWIENFNESFPDFAGRRAVFYWTIQDLINLELVREKPDNSYRFENLLGPAPGAESARSKQEKKAARKEELRSRNLIDIMDLEITDFGQAFLKFITNPVEIGSREKDSSSKP